MNENGDDEVTILGTAGDVITIIGSDAGNEVIKINGGNKHKVESKAGNDKITVTKGNNHQLYCGDGNDEVQVTGNGNTHEIYGGSGIDTIKVPGGNGHTIEGGEGNDKITVSNVTDSQVTTVKGDAGNDIIVVNNSQNTRIYTGSGNDDKVTVSGGETHNIYTDDGKNTITVTNADNVTITEKSGSAKDIITVNWSSNMNKLTIYTSSNDYFSDELYITGAGSRDTFTFKKNGDHLGMINSSDGIIEIKDYFWRTDHGFGDNIYIGGAQATYDYINSHLS